MQLFTFYFFIGLVLIHFFYFFGVFRKLATTPLNHNKTNIIPVSIIVYTKNEASIINKFIQILSQQDYPNYEIVLIDDASTDQTNEIFESLKKNYDNIKIVKVKNNETFWGNKKYALTLGIKAAKHDNLLFLEINCYPKSKNWISQMFSDYNSQKTIVLGYVSYEKIAGSLLNKIIRYENLLTSTQYFSWSLLGKPYMGVGKNLAYDRKVFYDVNGFINHIKIPFGDDDLFVNQAANYSNTIVCCSSDGFVIAKPKTTFIEWFLDKRKQISTLKYYKLFDKIQLSIFYLSQLLFIILSIVLISFKYQLIPVLCIIIFRYIFTWVIISNSAKKFLENDLIIWYPFLEIITIYIQLRLYITNFFDKS